MSSQIIQGQTGVFNPATDILNTGWTTDGVFAYHSGCNPGTMVALNTFGLQVGRAYTITYTVNSITSGYVSVIAGTLLGIQQTAPGTYTEVLVMTGNPYLSFYSNGVCTISKLNFYDTLLGFHPGRTITFNDKYNKWVQEWGWQSEMMVNFIQKFFTFNGGTLWLNNSNTVMGNFFGEQYSVQVKCIPNKDHELNKIWYNLRANSIGKWFVADFYIPPNDQFPGGMDTMMSLKNVKYIDGKLWADILRDMTDPNFYHIADQNQRAGVSMFKGRKMQGNYAIITLQCNDTTLATITSIETYYTEVKKSI